MSATAQMIAIDLAAILLLVFAIYFPRHRRADLAAAFLGVNVGVLAVSIVLASSTAGVGLGLGLFGVLSIIRLRSSEISQREVAYYFASLALGLICGMTTTFTPLIGGLLALLVLTLALADSRLLLGRYETQLVQLDRAVAQPEELRLALSQRLGAEVVGTNVVKLDFVNDLTLVEVRMRRLPVATVSPANLGQLQEVN